MTLPKRPRLRQALEAIGQALGLSREPERPVRTLVMGLSAVGRIALTMEDGKGGRLLHVDMVPAAASRPADRKARCA